MACASVVSDNIEKWAGAPQKDNKRRKYLQNRITTVVLLYTPF
jgi:hypothetical protein